MPFDLSVVIPCYNEAFRLDCCFDVIREHLDINWEWLFIDDGSTDQTESRLTDFSERARDKIKVVKLDENVGKGGAVCAGFHRATAPLVGYIDADMAASPLEFQRFLAADKLTAGLEIVLGIRLKTQHGQVDRRFYRHIMGRVFQTYTSCMTGLTVYDTQCGFKLMSTDLARTIANQMHCHGFAFDVELLLIAVKIGVQLREELIQWQEKGDSSIRPYHILQMAVDIWKITRRHGQVR